MKKTEKGTHHVVFQPTFGNRPDQYIGHDGVIEQFMAGLQEPVGSRNRCTLFLGPPYTPQSHTESRFHPAVLSNTGFLTPAVKYGRH